MAPETIDATGQVHSADEGATHHGGEDPRGLNAVPRSPLFEGRFGRMFRTQAPSRPPRQALEALGKALKERGSRRREAGDNPDIPAAYTYLGQFIDHDTTFDPTSQLQRFNDPDALVSFRSPRFDLDSLYGSGPSGTPFLYEWTDRDFRGVKLIEGRNPEQDKFGNALERRDLPRNRQGRALIGDPRNDENIIVGQLHFTFLRFHNKVVDRLASGDLSGGALFEEARRITTWHYQWVVVRDFLVKTCGKAVVDSILATDGTVTRQFFTWEDGPYIPVEFSGAAYRFGHSQVRPSYDLNEAIPGIPLFSADARADRDIFSHLNGFRPLPVGWEIDWSFFTKIGSRKPQPSRLIDTHLAEPLLKLPTGIDAKHNGLPLLNLRRGKALQLPPGQAVAAAMGVPAIAGNALGLRNLGLSAAHQTLLEAETPLWYYILREAESQEAGKRLGAVGARIVAEVLIGLLEGDKQSFLNQQPDWRPDLPAKTKGDFTLADLLKLATAR